MHGDQLDLRRNMSELAQQIAVHAGLTPGSKTAQSIQWMLPALRMISRDLDDKPLDDRQALIEWALAKAKEHLDEGGMDVTAERFLLVAKALLEPLPKLWIVSAAVNIGGLIFSMPRPARHGDILREASLAMGGKTPVQGVQGFVTNDGRFLDRASAANVARAAGQIQDDKNELFSEDLW